MKDVFFLLIAFLIFHAGIILIVFVNLFIHYLFNDEWLASWRILYENLHVSVVFFIFILFIAKIKNFKK